jgi:hypothetical protein
MVATNVFASFLICLCAVLCAAQEVDPGDETLAEARRKRETVVAELNEAVRHIEKERLAAIKKKDAALSQRLLPKLANARQELAAAKKKPLDEYAADIAAEREKEKRGQAERRAAQQREREQQRLASERAAADEADAERRALAEREAALAEQKREPERFAKSGGCPLKVWGTAFSVKDVDSIRRGYRLMGYRDTFPAHLSGECIFVSCRISNRVDLQVDAYDLRIQFINGFDEVIKEQVLQGTNLPPGKETRLENGWPKIETVVKVRVLIDRTKLNDGQLWKREPHHEFVSDTSK